MSQTNSLNNKTETISLNLSAVPMKTDLKSKQDDPKVAEKLADIKDKYSKMRNSVVQRKLASMTSDQLPMTLDVSMLTPEQKNTLVQDLQNKGYTVEPPKLSEHAKRKANRTQVAEARATALAARKAQVAAQQEARVKNPKNAEDASKENAADAEMLAKKQAEHAAPVAKANAGKFERKHKVDNLVIN